MESLFIHPSEFVLTGTINRFEGPNAVIITEDKQTLIWPIKKLPINIKQGEAVKLILSTDKLGTKDREQTTKFILNQILKK